MKALCEERLIDWHKKFSNFGLSCISVTGDSDNIDLQSLANHNLIITTPEKWDSLTRKWKDNKTLVHMVTLFMIDEVHLLNEESRGPTLEAIVSRMKTIEDSIPFESGVLGEVKYTKIRFIAVSATVPNVEDIAEWIGKSTKAKYFSFPDEIRPVKLKKIVLGYSQHKQTSYFKFDLFLNYKLQHLLLQYSMGRPTLIFCSTRKSTEMTARHIVQNLTISLSENQKKRLVEASKQLIDKKVSEMLIFGVAYHHAGMLPETRHTIEELFRNSELPVLVTTSTLAMGVNLPAHLVIVKSTKCYIRGQFQDYSDTAILQMIGRAGRPQFDTSATALILTTLADKPKFEKMIGGVQPIESNLHRHLTEHLNAEVVLHTIKDLDVALQWLSSTFLYIRARKNPRHYGLPSNMTPEQIDKKLLDMCQIEINKLVKARMLTLDHNIVISPTILGSLMAKYYIAFETMRLFAQLNGNEIMQQIISLISKCHEFSEMYLRVDDKKCLNLLNKSQTRQTIRFPLKGRIKTLDMKINCIIQAVLGCLEINDHSILSETYKIMRNAERIAKCLIEYLQTRENCYAALLNTIILAKCFHARLWEDSPYVSKQLSGIGTALSNYLVTAGKTSFRTILNSSPRELEMITKKKPPFGDNILNEVHHLPFYEMLLEFACVEKGIDLKLTITLKNVEDLLVKCTANLESMMCLLVGNDFNDVLLYEKYSHAYLIENPEIVKIITVENTETAYVTAHFISENWVGLDCSSTLTLKPENSTGENSKKTTASNETEAKSIKEKNRLLLEKFLSGYCKSKKVSGRKIKKVVHKKKGEAQNSQVAIDDHFTQDKVQASQQEENPVQNVSDSHNAIGKSDKVIVDQSVNVSKIESNVNGNKCKDILPSEIGASKGNSEREEIISDKNIMDGIEDDIQAFLNNADQTFSQVVAENNNQISADDDTNEKIDTIDITIDSTDHSVDVDSSKKNLPLSSYTKVQNLPNYKRNEVNAQDFNNETFCDDSVLNSQISRLLKDVEMTDKCNKYPDSNNQFEANMGKERRIIPHWNTKFQNNTQRSKSSCSKKTINDDNNYFRTIPVESNLNISQAFGTPCKTDETHSNQLAENSSYSQYSHSFKATQKCVKEFTRENSIDDAVLNSQISRILEKYFKDGNVSSQNKREEPVRPRNQQAVCPPPPSSLNKNNEKVDLSMYKFTPRKKFSHSRNEPSLNLERNSDPEVMYRIIEELHPSKKQRCIRNDSQVTDEIMSNLEEYMQIHTKQNTADENGSKRNIQAGKSISWRSPLIYSPPVKFSPHIPQARSRLNTSDMDSSNEKHNDTLETSVSSKTALPPEPHYFKTPSKTRSYPHISQAKQMNYKSGPQFPLTDRESTEVTNHNLSLANQNLLNDSYVSRENDAANLSSLQELCSTSFLDNLGLLHKEKQQKMINNSQLPNKQKHNVLSPTVDYLSQMVKFPQNSDSGFSSRSRNMMNTPPSNQHSSNTDERNEGIMNRSLSNSQFHCGSQTLKPQQFHSYNTDKSPYIKSDSCYKTDSNRSFQHPGYGSNDISQASNLNRNNNLVQHSRQFSAPQRCNNLSLNNNFTNMPAHINPITTRNLIVPADRQRIQTETRNDFLPSNDQIRSPCVPWHNPNTTQVLRSLENSPTVHSIATSAGQMIHNKCKNQSLSFALCENGKCSCGHSKENNILTQNFSHTYCPPDSSQNRACTGCSNASQYFSYPDGTGLRNLNEQHSYGRSRCMKKQCCRSSSPCQLPNEDLNVSSQFICKNPSTPRSRSIAGHNVSDNGSWHSSDHSQKHFSGDAIHNKVYHGNFMPTRENWNSNSMPFDGTRNYMSGSRYQIPYNKRCDHRKFQSPNFNENMPFHRNYTLSRCDNRNNGLHSSDCNSCCNRTMFENNISACHPPRPRPFPEFGEVDTDFMNEDQMLERYYSHYIGDKQYVMNKFFDSLEHEHPDCVPFDDARNNNLHGNDGTYLHP